MTVSGGLLQIRPQPHERRAEMGRRIVAEFFDLREPVECRLNDTALHTASPPVDDANFAKSRPRSGVDVLLHDRWNIARCKGVQIDFPLDRHVMRHGYFAAFEYVAVTFVVMPPRAEKSPTMVMRLGASSVTRSSRI
jgi:hypothetical protein